MCINFNVFLHYVNLLNNERMGCDTCSTATVFTLTGGPTVHYSGREAACPPRSL